MRHEKAAQVIDLARRLAASAEGLTLDEMAAAIGSGRRTAERMRDALEALFPQMEVLQEGTVKRFRLPKGLDGFFQVPTLDELVEVSKASAALRRMGSTSQAEALERLELKIRGALRASALRKLSTDVDVLTRAEGSTTRAGPRPFEDAAQLASLRHAIMAMRAVRFKYLGGSRPGSLRTVCPYGILFDRMNYLIAAELGGAEPRSWRLDRIEALELTETAASPPPDFDLAAYAAQSFGIYQGGVEDVVLRVLPAGVEDARRWRFHGTQTLEEQTDGSLIIRFRSAGMLELSWHLFTWENKIVILEPEVLRQMMTTQLEKALLHHKPAPAAKG